MTTATTNSDSMKATIDGLVQEIEREFANHPQEGDQLAAFLETLRVRGPGRVEALKEALRNFVLDMAVPVDVRQYAAAKLDAIAAR